MFITATTIPDAWFQALYALVDHGYKFTVERGSYEGETRLQLPWFNCAILHPYSKPWDTMLPEIPPALGIPNPVEPGYVEQYMPYIMSPHVEPGEQYTYGSRIYVQMVYWIEQLKKTPGTNQAILQVGRPEDYFLSDPPCLRHIDMCVIDNRLWFYPYFRSWDLWGGFPANLAGIAVLQKYMADEIGIRTGPMYVSSAKLHVYGYVEELAKLRCYKED